jgi:hypothetical protein
MPHFEFRNEDRRSEKSCEGHATPHIYWEDASMCALKRAFLDGGFIPPGLDEDDPNMSTMVAAVAAELDGTCEIPDMWVNSVNMGKILTPPLLFRSYW